MIESRLKVVNNVECLGREASHCRKPLALRPIYARKKVPVCTTCPLKCSQLFQMATLKGGFNDGCPHFVTLGKSFLEGIHSVALLGVDIRLLVLETQIVV